MVWVCSEPKDGKISLQELTYLLRSFRVSLSADQITQAFRAADADHSGAIDRAEFAALIHSLQPTWYQAVCADVEEGMRRYRAIKDHTAQPMAMLVSREAFNVMFPARDGRPQTVRFGALPLWRCVSCVSR